MVGFLLAGLALSVADFISTPLPKAGAELGVTLLLFTIGLKLKVKNLLKPEVWGAGLLHMGLSVTILGFALFCLGFFAGLDFNTALIVGFALSFSSTVFAVKILEESGRMNSLNGRTAIGVLIIQDIIAVVYALLLIGLLPVIRRVFLRVMSRVGHGELLVLLGLDFDMETVVRLQADGRNIVRADVTDLDFWRRMPAIQGTTVKLVVLAMGNLEAMLLTTRILKEKGFQGKVAAMAHYDDEVEALHDSGVDTAYNIFGEAGVGLATHVCESLETFCVVDGRP